MERIIRLLPVFEYLLSFSFSHYRQWGVPITRFCALLSLALSVLGNPLPVKAGGGPENVLLLVNSNSDSSKTIANHYIEMRGIPPRNVVYLDWQGNLRRTTGESFRSKILMPAIDWIESRKLGPQIDYLVYSTDFPRLIDLKDLFDAEKLPPGFDARSSLTGASYLTPYVVSKNPAIVMPDTNWYVPRAQESNFIKCEQLSNVPTRGFRAMYLWDKAGERTKDAEAGQRYLLSTMLGATSERGNTEAEILSYLKRAKESDGKRPRGTIYFMRNNDIRSQTRHTCFDGIAAEINKIGVRAVVQTGGIPRSSPDVMGLMAGVARFDWETSGSTILPGAICEHLTSFGGELSTNSGQTPLSVFLRYGAAGASGTVVEPRALQSKFPLPSLQLHYARGASLAEAFYQSITGPYQILIVGDPLCQPWAKFPTVTLDGIKPNQELKGTVTLKPGGALSGGQGLQMFDLYLDGKLAARMGLGKSLQVDTTKLADGYHELRLVGIATGPLETQGRVVVPMTVNNKGGQVALELSSVKVPSSGTLKVSVKQPGATAIVVRQNSREVGRVEGEAGEVEILAATLGRGPSHLQAFSEGEAAAISAPAQVFVE